VEEDIPGMLEKAKKYNYQIVIYVKNTDDVNHIKIKNLLSTGSINEIIKYNNKNEILSYVSSSNKCNTWYITPSGSSEA
jgi:hypothetical protein